MNSSKQIGFISNIPICKNDLCIFIPLLPNQKKQNKRIKPTDYLTPISLPVFGVYQEINSTLKRYKKDKNTLAIEAYFECDIPIFIQQINNNYFKNASKYQDPTKKNIISNIKGVFEHQDIYFSMIKMSKIENKSFNYLKLKNFLKTQQHFEETYNKLKNKLELDKNLSEENKVLLKKLQASKPLEVIQKKPEILPFGNWQSFCAIYKKLIINNDIDKAFKDFELFIKTLFLCSKGFDLPFEGCIANYKAKSQVLKLCLNIMKEKQR